MSYTDVALKFLSDSERLERIKPIVKAAMKAGVQYDLDLEAGALIIQVPEYATFEVPND